MTSNAPPRWSADSRKKVLILSSSPRLTGNSSRLARAVGEGATGAGHEVAVVDLVQHVPNMLRHCRTCRQPDGECAIEDNYKRILLDLYLPAQAVVFATPIWWYGVSAYLKSFIDRFFCYMADSSPYAAEVTPKLMGKRLALVLSAEESNFAARLGILEQMSELARYLHCDFVGVVTGIGNRQGEVADDPAGSVEEARRLGERLFRITSTDYKIDTPRAKRIWEGAGDAFPGYWR